MFKLAWNLNAITAPIILQLKLLRELSCIAVYENPLEV